jgi:hypothetical protein
MAGLIGDGPGASAADPRKILEINLVLLLHHAASKSQSIDDLKLDCWQA